MENVNKQNICNEVVLVFVPRQIREGKKHTSWEYFLSWQRCDHMSTWFEIGTSTSEQTVNTLHLHPLLEFRRYQYSKFFPVFTPRNLSRYDHRLFVPISFFILPDLKWLFFWVCEARLQEPLPGPKWGKWRFKLLIWWVWGEYCFKQSGRCWAWMNEINGHLS